MVCLCYTGPRGFQCPFCGAGHGRDLCSSISQIIPTQMKKTTVIMKIQLAFLIVVFLTVFYHDYRASTMIFDMKSYKRHLWFIHSSSDVLFFPQESCSHSDMTMSVMNKALYELCIFPHSLITAVLVLTLKRYVFVNHISKTMAYLKHSTNK